jgi:predicted patatin/cPLA2 family phospholipase
MTIQHLVIGGGGPFGFTAFGVLKQLHDLGFWNIKNIKTIYATSVGALISTFLLLGYDYGYIYDYFVKRPWEKIFKHISVDNIFNIYSDKGAIELYTLYVECLTMVLEAKGMTSSVTLKDFYEFSGVELNIIVTEINSFKYEIISHKTYPYLELLKALTMTAALPVIFTPQFLDNKCFIDGGIFSNYPLNICLNETKCQKNEILGVRKKNICQYPIITKESSFIEYIFIAFQKILDKIGDHNNVEIIPYDIMCDVDIFNDYSEWFNLFSVSDKRKTLIDSGVNNANEIYPSFLEKYNHDSEEIHNTLTESKEEDQKEDAEILE